MGALFDLSFKKFIAPTIAKIAYVIILVAVALTYLLFVVSSFSRNAGFGLFVLVILGPLFSLLYLVIARVVLEALLAQIRTAENTTEMLQIMRGQGPGPLGQPLSPAGPWAPTAPISTPPSAPPTTPYAPPAPPQGPTA